MGELKDKIELLLSGQIQPYELKKIITILVEEIEKTREVITSETDIFDFTQK